MAWMAVGAIVCLQLPEVLRLDCQAHGSQRRLCHGLELTFDGISPLVRQGFDLSVGQHDLGASLYEHLRSALGEEDVATGGAVVPEHTHGLAVPAEFQDGLLLHALLPVLRESHSIFLRPLVLLVASLVERLVRTAELLDQDTDGSFSGLAISDELLLIIDQEPRLVAHAADLGQGLDGLVLPPIDVQLRHAAHRHVVVTFDIVVLQPVAVGESELHHAHLVGRQRSSLVGANDSRATQRLHGGQLADDGVSLGHLPCAQG
mmetsp:Transcript_52697/g.126102  ORF Transcript_52697/g.126102 Transcript_52697/m.126102 type:complete len:261 (-) Transcript_52697:1086-1868(-)